MHRHLCRFLWLIVLLGSMPVLSEASTVVPPTNPGGLVHDSDHIALAVVIGSDTKFRGKMLVTITRFEIVQSVKGITSGRIIDVETPGGVLGDIGLQINGSPRFMERQSYLLFLREFEDGTYRPIMLSYGVMRLVDSLQDGVFVPIDQTWDLELLPRRDARPVELIRPYRSNALLAHLRAVVAGAEWDATDVADEDYPAHQSGGFVTDQTLSGCSYLTYEGVPIRWNIFDQNEALSFYIADDATNFQQTSVQVGLINWGDLDEFRFAGKLEFAGKRSFTPNCAEYESAADALIDEDGNFMVGDGMVQFNDPCEEIPDLTINGGVLAFGGTFFFLNTHQYNSMQWRTSALAYVVVNNGTESFLGPIQYNQMMAHELGHTLGFGHHTDAPALMNAFCCNALSDIDKTCAVLPYGDLPPNDPPVVANALAAITLYYPGAAFVKNLTVPVPVFTDPDGDQLVYSVLSADEGVVFADMATPNAIRLRPNNVGQAVVLVRAADPRGAFVTFELEVNVEPKVNIIPEIVRQPDAAALNEGATITLEMEGSEPFIIDKDGDKLVYSVINQTPDIVTAEVQGTQVGAIGMGPGVGRVTIVADDQSGGRVEVDWVLTVNGKPRLLSTPEPVTLQAQSDNGIVDLMQPRLFEDPEGGALSYSISNSAALYYDASLSGTILALKPKQPGTGLVTVTAQDLLGNTNSVGIPVIVQVRPNNNPVLLKQPGAIQLSAGSEAYVLDLEGEQPVFNDPDADTLSYSAISSLNRIASVSVSGSLLFIEPGEMGNAVLTIFATDQFGGFASANIPVTVGMGVNLGEESLPQTFEVGPAYPNPFNPSTIIPIRQPTHDQVEIVVFDIMGRQVYSRQFGMLQPGSHLLELSLGNHPSGVYLVAVRSGSVSLHQRITLRK